MGKHSKTMDKETKKKIKIIAGTLIIMIILCICIYYCNKTEYSLFQTFEVQNNINNTNTLNNTFESNIVYSSSTDEITDDGDDELKGNEILDLNTYINDLESVEGEKLVLKSKATPNKYIEYDF